MKKQKAKYEEVLQCPIAHRGTIGGIINGIGVLEA